MVRYTIVYNYLLHRSLLFKYFSYLYSQYRINETHTEKKKCEESVKQFGTCMYSVDTLYTRRIHDGNYAKNSMLIGVDSRKKQRTH